MKIPLLFLETWRDADVGPEKWIYVTFGSVYVKPLLWLKGKQIIITESEKNMFWSSLADKLRSSLYPL